MRIIKFLLMLIVADILTWVFFHIGRGIVWGVRNGLDKNKKNMTIKEAHEAARAHFTS